MTEAEIVSEIIKIVDIEPEKISFRINKLLEQKKIYSYQREGIALENHGDMLEDEIEELMNGVFYKPFVFKNPKMKDGVKELCDILVYFGTTLILIQAKTSKFNGDYKQFVKRAVKKSIYQLRASVNRCKGKKTDIELIDIHGRKLKIPKGKIENIYGVCVAYQIEPILSHDKARMTYDLKLDSVEEMPHILSNEELKTIINYLDTPKDLTDYLSKREIICQNPKHLFLSEKDIISFYYSSNRTMVPKGISSEEYGKADGIFLDGLEEDLEIGALSKQIEKRKSKDKPSYAVDEFIHSIESEERKNFQEIKIIDYFHNMNRFERRLLGEKIFLKFEECMKKKKEFGFCVSHVLQNEEAYLIIFSELSYEETEKRAETLLKMIKAKLNKEKIIGVVFQDYLEEETLKYRFLIDESISSEEEKKELLDNYSKLFKEPEEERGLYEFD